MSKITTGQNKRIWGKLNATEEVAWRDDYVAKASNNRVYNMSELSIDEAHVMISLLHDVEIGLRKPCNPHSDLQKRFNELPHTLISIQRDPSPRPVETDVEKANRLRRNVLRYCHDMGTWYKQNADGTYVIKGDKPVLNYEAIDHFCETHSAAKKKLNDHNIKELTELVRQFKTMAQNTVLKKEKKT